MDWIARFAAHARQCMAQPLGFPDCNEFWGVTFLVGITVLGIGAIKLIYRSYGSWRDEQRAVEEIIGGKRVASPEVMEQFRWKGDKALDTGMSYEQIVGSIKDEAAKRKDALQ